MTTPRISRRMLLQGLGVSIALPWLDAMAPVARSAMAETANAPLRMGFFYVPNGMHMPDWRPAKEGAKFELPKTLQALEKHRDNLSVLTGLTLDGARAHQDGGGDHARSGASFLTGSHPRKTDGADIQNSISVDQVAAQAIGDKTRFPSLELGLEGSAQSGSCDSGYSCAYSSNLAWRSSTSPLGKEMDPSAVFDRLFGNLKKSTESEVASPREKYRKSVLDYVLDDAKSLRNKVGNSDQRKLDEYLYAIRDIENRMSREDQIIGIEDGKVNYPRPAGVPSSLDEHCKLMLDMMVLAFQTDSTRIASFMFNNEGSNRAYREIDVAEGHHDLSHHGKNAEKQEKVAKINRYHVSKLAYLLDRLSAAKEGERSLLENCMLIYGSGISDGDRHNHDDLPILLCGKAGGRIRQAKHWVFPNETPLCNLYLWMLAQMGVKADSFGDSKGQVKLT